MKEIASEDVAARKVSVPGGAPSHWINRFTSASRPAVRNSAEIGGMVSEAHCFQKVSRSQAPRGRLPSNEDNHR